MFLVSIPDQSLNTSWKQQTEGKKCWHDAVLKQKHVPN
jgi:hypothetical protein